MYWRFITDRIRTPEEYQTLKYDLLQCVKEGGNDNGELILYENDPFCNEIIFLIRCDKRPTDNKEKGISWVEYIVGVDISNEKTN